MEKWYTQPYEESGVWFRDLDELIQAIEADGGEVAYADAEMVDFFMDENTEYWAKIAGTERTKYIERIEVEIDEDE